MNGIRDGQQLAKMKTGFSDFVGPENTFCISDLEAYPLIIFLSCTLIGQTIRLTYYLKILLMSMSTERMPKSIDNKFTINSTGCHKIL